MQTRNCWVETQMNGLFKWKPTSTKNSFSSLDEKKTLFGTRAFNHFEFHNQISNKDNLLLNLSEYCAVRIKIFF